MGCIYNVNCDKCSMYDKEEHDGQHYGNSEFGFSKENDGTCAVDEDPKPQKNCSMFESIDSSDECECVILGSLCDACEDEC